MGPGRGGYSKGCEVIFQCVRVKGDILTYDILFINIHIPISHAGGGGGGGVRERPGSKGCKGETSRDRSINLLTQRLSRSSAQDYTLGLQYFMGCLKDYGESQRRHNEPEEEIKSNREADSA